jgi:patatin-like phospholipase/acyl hydrolase
MEEENGRPIAQCFDLLAGTSVGGMIALALAAEVKAESIKHTFMEEGASIFSNRPAPRTSIGEFIDFCRSAIKSKYGAERLRDAAVSLLGKESTVGQLKHPVVIPVVNLTKGKPQVIKTDHHPDFKLDHKHLLVDVAMAASAAPTFFPVAEIGNELFADGGLYANSPDLIAFHEARTFFKVHADEVRMLSIGTTTSRFSFSHVGKRDLGIYQWRKRLPYTIISSQQMDVGFIMKHVLGDNYIRIDAIQSKEQESDLGLDVATAEAQSTICGLADATYQDHCSNNTDLLRMLEYEAKAPKFYYRQKVG